MKKFRKLSVILLVFVFIGGGLIYALTLGEGIENKERVSKKCECRTVQAINFNN